MPKLRRALPVLAVPVLAVTAAPAGAMIVPQDNIAGVKIGMSQEKVSTIIGFPRKTITQPGGSGGDDFITTWTYPRRGLKVFFHPNRANTKNVAISVAVYRHRKQRTAEGIGLGSTRRAVKKKVAGVRCKRYDPTYAICSIGKGKRGTINTTFWLNRRNKVKLVTLAKITND